MNGYDHQDENVDYGYESHAVPERSMIDETSGPLHRAYSSAFSSDESIDNLSSEDSFHNDIVGRVRVKHDDHEVTEVERLAKTMRFKIQVGRCGLVAIIFCLGVLASISTYLILTKSEQKQFAVGFQLLGEVIRDAVKVKITSLVRAHQGLSSEITAFSISTKTYFPFVTLPLFEVNARNARGQSGMDLVAFLPLVSLWQRALWEDYSGSSQGWISASQKLERNSNQNFTSSYQDNFPISSFIFERSNQTPAAAPVRAPSRSLYAPFWLSSPAFASLVNRNMMTQDLFGADFTALLAARESVFGQATSADFFSSNIIPGEDSERRNPEGVYLVLFSPVYEDFDTESPIVGLLAGWFDVSLFLSNLLPPRAKGIQAILKNTCGQTYSFCLRGTEASSCGSGDVHDRKFDGLHMNVSLLPANFSAGARCMYSVDFYPTSEYGDIYLTSLPFIAMAVVAVLFISMGLAFSIYDRFVQKKNKQVVGAAARSTAIISSLFPALVRDRLFASTDSRDTEDDERKPLRPGAQTRLRRFLNNENDEEEEGDQQARDKGQPSLKSKPIADLFPETTVLFGDIVGFTAWASVREPAQVFTLLETLYASFDEIAKRRRVFKVETVGDCYVAVTGLPDPRKDHAVAMARFARDCMSRMETLTKSMEVELGPDTGELCMRMGLHSGPVTAGVLRGDRARFQLFGDTMNTAARMESTGVPRKIQVSEETAELLRQAGKEDWIRPREDVVMAKGKGTLKTYWLFVSAERRATVSLLHHQLSFRRPSIIQNFIISDTDGEKVSEKMTRLIEWNVEVLLRLLKLIVAHRRARGAGQRAGSLSMLSRIGNVGLLGTGEVGRASRASVSSQSRNTAADSTVSRATTEESNSRTPLEEVTEVIRLPDFDAKSKPVSDSESEEIGINALEQLSDLVSKIAGMYSKKNPFHNFEHASHVTMSVVKLMSRIVAPEINVKEEAVGEKKNMAYVLHDHTYGITSDPLTQFACVFSALVHDIDHSGVPNTQLVKEHVPIAEKYKGKSVAEQNSVDLAWNLFMEDQFFDLRFALCSTDKELKRLRQLVVNSVLATDIMDKDLKALRNARWEKAFAEEAGKESSSENRNRKATIVIEHLIQASDIAHTMQHWHIYRKWNERLFMEMAKAYDEGRADKHPSEFWYQGEIGFFDNYIIPLAKKLKDCGVFGVSSDEYLNYAMKNRQEWATRGQEVVGEMMERLNRQMGKMAQKQTGEPLNGGGTKQWFQSGARALGPRTPSSPRACSTSSPRRQSISGSQHSNVSVDSAHSKGKGFPRASFSGRTQSVAQFFSDQRVFWRRNSGSSQEDSIIQPRRFSAGFVPQYKSPAEDSVIVFPRRFSTGYVAPARSERFRGRNEGRDVAISKPVRTRSREEPPVKRSKAIAGDVSVAVTKETECSDEALLLEERLCFPVRRVPSVDSLQRDTVAGAGSLEPSQRQPSSSEHLTPEHQKAPCRNPLFVSPELGPDGNLKPTIKKDGGQAVVDLTALHVITPPSENLSRKTGMRNYLHSITPPGTDPSDDDGIGQTTNLYGTSNSPARDVLHSGTNGSKGSASPLERLLSTSKYAVDNLPGQANLISDSDQVNHPHAEKNSSSETHKRLSLEQRKSPDTSKFQDNGRREAVPSPPRWDAERVKEVSQTQSAAKVFPTKAVQEQRKKSEVETGQPKRTELRNGPANGSDSGLPIEYPLSSRETRYSASSEMFFQ